MVFQPTWCYIRKTDVFHPREIVFRNRDPQLQVGKNYSYIITSVPDHFNKQITSRLGPLLSSPKVFPIDVMLKD